MKKKVRLADIAAELGVSAVTVHNALVGNKGVSDDLREQVFQVAKKMGYRHPLAQARKDEEPFRKIGMLISERYLAEYTTYYWKIYQEMAIVATDYRCMVPAEILRRDQEANQIMPQMVTEGMIDGIIILGEVSRAYIAKLKEVLEIPLVFLDFYDRDLADDAVIADNFYGMYRLTEYVFDCGLRRLAYVGSIHATSSIMDRYCGFYRALLAHGETLPAEWLIEDRDAGGRMEIHLPDVLPEAFVCNCDLTAGLVIRMLEKRGLRVPEDVSVIGFDNYMYPGFQDQQITTYEVDTRKMAQLALVKILRYLNEPGVRHSLEVVPGHIVERASVRKAEQ